MSTLTYQFTMCNTADNELHDKTHCDATVTSQREKGGDMIEQLSERYDSVQLQ